MITARIATSTPTSKPKAIRSKIDTSEVGQDPSPAFRVRERTPTEVAKMKAEKERIPIGVMTIQESVGLVLEMSL